MKSFKQHVQMMNEAPLHAKGWVNAKKKKAEVSSLKVEDFYHVTMVTQDPEKYGLTKKKIIKYFKSIKAFDPKGEFEKLATGQNDMWPAVDSMAMANGWVRFTADDYAAEITAESWEDVHQAAKFILEFKGLERVAETFMKPPRQGVHLRVRRKGKSEVATKTLIKDAGDFSKWAFGSVADPDKAIKKKGGMTSIGSTMAQFREDTDEGDQQ
jgi:hypothetical protein